MAEQAKKHPCPDCLHCQWCSDDRCRLCLKTTCCRKLSQAEQIALYEKLNAENPCENLTESLGATLPRQD